MNQDFFVSENRERWTRLESLLSTLAKGSLRALKSEEIRELGSLYRRITSDLSYARTKKYDSAVVEYLNELTGRAYGFLYSSDVHYWGRGWQFLSREFPALVLRHVAPILIAAAIFLAGSGFAFYHTWMDPRASAHFLPETFRRSLSDGDLRDRRQPSFPEESKPYISNQIMVNNIQVGLLAFAFGLTLGIGTIWVLFSNGLMLGSLAAVFAAKSQSLFFWSLILPHGVTELFCIFLCGAAGLMMGYSLLVPGNRYRGDSFRSATRSAVKLVLGSVPLFLVAAIIEGFVTPSPLPEEAKLVVAALTGLALVLYIRRGHGGAEQPATLRRP